MIDQKKLDQTLEQAFEKSSPPLPGDHYFNKIWDTIETRAPVGEKYYLRSFFSVFFFLLFFIVFLLFYTEFLSTVLTLKEIRQANASLFSSVSVPRWHPLFEQNTNPYPLTPMKGGIRLYANDKPLLQVKSETATQVEWDFFAGHVVIEKTRPLPKLVIHLPDLILTMEQGRCNLFCYDNIIRIIPLSFPVNVVIKGERLTIPPGKTLYLLNKKTVIY